MIPWGEWQFQLCSVSPVWVEWVQRVSELPWQHFSSPKKWHGNDAIPPECISISTLWSGKSIRLSKLWHCLFYAHDAPLLWFWGIHVARIQLQEDLVSLCDKCLMSHTLWCPMVFTLVAVGVATFIKRGWSKYEGGEHHSEGDATNDSSMCDVGPRVEKVHSGHTLQQFRGSGHNWIWLQKG